MSSRAGWTAVVLMILLGAIGQGQEFPGGHIQVREALVTERGSHPKVVVQTVPDATTTATCLVVKYSEPGTKSPPPYAAHMLEHLLYRSAPGEAPGGLLLQNEVQGNSSRAWTNAQEMILSEEVPSHLGLDSLKLQLKRLSAVPKDSEGLKMEAQAIRSEIRQARTPEEQGRRKILESLGLSAQLEGTWDSVKALSFADLHRVLAESDIKTEVVIAVVGPHSAREVRQVLSQTLQPLAPKREEARQKESAVLSEIKELKVESSAYSQVSLFFSPSHRDPQTLVVANSLLHLPRNGPGKARLERESGELYRLDTLTDWSLEVCLEDLSPQESEQLYLSYQRDWLERYESRQERAEMLALTALRKEQPERLLSREEFPAILERAKSLLRESEEAKARLILLPAEGASPLGRLFPFRQVARKEATTELHSQTLANGLTVSSQHREDWPTVALSGFFRVSPPLAPQQRERLQKYLNKNSELALEYEVKPGAIFFHAWRPRQELDSLLKSSASELKSLASQGELAAQIEVTRSGLVDSFFLPPVPQSPPRRLKGKALFNPKDAHLVVVGNFEQSTLDQSLRPAWSGWFGSRSAKAIFPPQTPKDGKAERTRSRIVDTPAGRPAILMVGLEGPTRSSPDFLAFNLALQTLAGRPSSSLLARKLQSGSAAVNSVKLIPLSKSEQGDRQVWVIALRLVNRLESPEPVLQKLDALFQSLAKSRMAARDLERTREFLKSRLTLSAADNPGRARVLAHAEFYRLSRSYTQDFAGLYDNLKPELVRAVCAPYLTEPKYRWLYLRPKTE